MNDQKNIRKSNIDEERKRGQVKDETGGTTSTNTGNDGMENNDDRTKSNRGDQDQMDDETDKQ